MATECPSLTTLTPDTVVLTADNIYELQVSTWNRTVGTVVKVKCQPGLQLEGQGTVICQSSGQWDASPLPKCVNIPPSTTPSPGVDASLVLMIVLIVISAVVIFVMMAICIALYQTYWRRKKDKIYGAPDYSNDTSSQPYSIFDRQRGDTHINEYNIYQQQSNAQERGSLHSASVDADNRKEDVNFSRDRRYRLPPYYKSHRHNNTIYLAYDGERNNTVETSDDFHESKRPSITDHPNSSQPTHIQRDRHRPTSDITAYYGGVYYTGRDSRGNGDGEDEFWNRKIVRRDHFLWRDMPSSWNSLRLPRPHYRL